VSPLWIKRFSAEPAVKAGIAIGRNQICAVVLDTKADSNEAYNVYRHDLPAPLFAGQPVQENETALADALLAVSREFRAEYAAVHVALPDTMIRSTVFELDELPKTSGLREALLRWRFAKEWQRPEDSLDCRGSDLGEDGGKRLFLGQAGDRHWIDCVRRALAQAGITPWSLNAAASYRFNRFHNAIALDAGALISLDTDCWNLLIWDGDGRIRRVLTRLRENASAGNEMNLIVNEVERAILSYANGLDGLGSNQIGKLYLAGSEKEMKALAALLDGRMDEGSVLLNADDGVSGAVTGMKDGMAALALTAALST
jgi:Tfp pilus assembly PilM family ATPase